MKPSIIRVVSNFYPAMGGSVKHIIELSIAMNPYLQSQLIVAPQYKSWIKDEFDERFPIPIKRVKASFINFSISQKIPGNSLINHLFYYAMNVSKTIKKYENDGYQFDIVQVHYNTLGLFLSFWFKIYRIPTPIIIMHHGSSINIESDSFFSNYFQKILLFLYGKFKPDYYIQLDDGTVNSLFMSKLKKMQIPTKIVYHAIDTEFYRQQQNKKTDNSFTILSNHRLEPFKRIDLSIIVFKKFLEQIGNPENVKLRIIGDGSLKRDLEILVTDNQLDAYVEFVGEKNFEEYQKELLSADIVIGTSLISNVNRSIQEAMASEKPVIVFDSISFNDLFKKMDNCLLVPVGDLEKFSQCMEILYYDKALRYNLGKNARTTILNYRTWKTRIEQELAIYSEIISKQHNGPNIDN